MFLFVRRYLFAKKSHSVVNIITALSLVSISLPVAAVIILLSIFNGFGELVESTHKVVDPDFCVVRTHGNLFDIESIPREAIEALADVEALSIISDQTMLLECEGRRAVVTVRGVDSMFRSVIPLDEGVFRGEYRVELGELDRIILGRSLAYRLGLVNIFDRSVDLYSLKGSGFSSMLPMSNYNRRSIKLSGLYSADVQSEEQFVITSLRAVQGLTGSAGKASQIFLSTTEGFSEQRLRRELREILGEGFEVKSRYQINPMLYDIVTYEKWGLLALSTLIMILASFTLIGALSMLIIEKRDNILTLRAMGGSWRFVRSIFFGEGLFISCVGVALGALVGCSVTLLQSHFGWVKIPASTFLSDHYPVELLASDVLIVGAMTLGIALLLSHIVVRQMIKKE